MNIVIFSRTLLRVSGLLKGVHIVRSQRSKLLPGKVNVSKEDVYFDKNLYSILLLNSAICGFESTTITLNPLEISKRII